MQEVNLEQYKACLAHLATSPEHATREDELGKSDDDRGYLEVVDPYRLDRIKLLGSKALIRLNDKTQVFIGRGNPHIRTRNRHTNEVVALASLIASTTGLNESLTVAAALGHDIGHLPFGHHGEQALSTVIGSKVSHAVVGVIIARRVERQANGLNLTRQTLEAILYHSSGAGKVQPSCKITQEATAVMWADKIAYVFADVNDFKRTLNDSEARLVNEMNRRASWFGCNQRQRIVHCVHALVKESAQSGRISFEQSECAQEFANFKDWLYKEAYFPSQKGRNVIIEGLIGAHNLLATCPEFGDCYIPLLTALLTDREARFLMELSFDHRTLSIEQIPHLGITEIYPHLRGAQIDLVSPWA